MKFLLITIISLLSIIPPIQLQKTELQQIVDTGLNVLNQFLKVRNANETIGIVDMQYTQDEDTCWKSVKNVFAKAYEFTTNCSISKKRPPDKRDCLDIDWSVRMIDALPVKPTGLLRKGPFFFMGDYEMCKEIMKKDREGVHYCTIKGSLGMRVMRGMEGQNPPFTIGLCLPSTCGSEMLYNLMTRTQNIILSGRKSVIEYESVDCKLGEDPEWSFKKPFVITFSFFVVGSIIVGTLLEKFQKKGVIRMKTIKSVKSAKHVPLETTHDENSENEDLHDENDNRSDRTSKADFSEAVDDDHCSSLYQGPNPMVCAPSIALTYRSSPPNLSKWSAYTIFIEIITSFSIISSFNYLFRNSTREVRLINGIRVITSFWVTFSHTCLFSLQFTDTVRSLADSTATSSAGGSRSGEQKLLSSFMLNSSLAVDTFLFVSACVATFSIRKRMIFRASEQLFSLKRAFAVLIHRILRLLPALCLYLAFMSVVYNHLGDGPFWNTRGMFGSDCNASSIWPHFIFLSNFFPSGCAPWLWHIALDFQLYLIFPLIFWILTKMRFGWCSVVGLTMVALTYRALVYGFYTLPVNMFVEMLSGRFEKAEMSYRLLYTSPISRAPPFLIGILTGWYICRPAQGPPMKWAVRTSLQSLSMLLMVMALFGPIASGPVFGYSHAVVHRTIWSIGIAIMVFLAQNGYSGIVGFLSDPRFVVLSRLSFGVFLSHEPILLYYLNTLRQPISPDSFGYFLFISVSLYFISVLFSLLIAIVVEIPLVTLERKFLMKTSEPGPADMHSRRRNSSKRVSFSEDLEIGMDEMGSDEKTRHWLEKNPLTTPFHDIHSHLNLDSEDSPIELKAETEEEAEVLDELKELTTTKSRIGGVSESSA